MNVEDKTTPTGREEPAGSTTDNEADHRPPDERTRSSTNEGKGQTVATFEPSPSTKPGRDSNSVGPGKNGVVPEKQKEPAPTTGDEHPDEPEKRELIAKKKSFRYGELLQRLKQEIGSRLIPGGTQLGAESEPTTPRSEAPRARRTDYKHLLRRIWDRLFKNEAALTVEAPKGLPRFAEHVSGLRTIFIDIALIALVLLLATTVWREIGRDVVLIEPFTLTPELINRGYTPESISSMLVNKVDILTKKANTNMPRREFTSNFSESLPEIEVPEAHVSLKSIVRYIKGFFSTRASVIEGEASMHGEEIRLVVRVVKDRAERSQPDIGIVADKDPDAAFLGAAEHIVKATEPYVLAAYFYSSDDEDSSLVLIQYCLYHGPPEDDCWAYNLWGLILSDRKNYDGAIEMFRRAVEKYPGNQFAVAYGNRALVSARKGDFNEAEEMCKIALSIDQKSPSSHNVCGSVSRREANRPKVTAEYREKKLNEAEAEFREAVTLSPNFAAAYNNWGNLLADDRKDYEAAISMFRLAIEVDPFYSDAYNNLGDALENHGELDRATAMYRKSGELDPRSYIAPINAGDILLRQENYGEAAVVYQEAMNRIAKFTRDATLRSQRLALAYSKLGDVSLKQKNLKAAFDLYQRALGLDPNVGLKDEAKSLVKRFQNKMAH